MGKKIPQNIDDESSYQQTLSILSKQNRRSRILCMLMNMLESYRQKRKMGWSRPWNKYGLTTFQSFRLDAKQDRALAEQALVCLKSFHDAPQQAFDFTHQLLTSPKHLMGFLFFSEYVEDGQQYETATLSFGRKVSVNARFRDRFDIIFDAPLHNNEPQALSRVRLYVDPYEQDEKEPLWSIVLNEKDIPEELSKLFASVCALSWQWQSKEEKHWNHWTSRYIDYFGERSVLPAYSHFYVEGGQSFAEKFGEEGCLGSHARR